MSGMTIWVLGIARRRNCGEFGYIARKKHTGDKKERDTMIFPQKIRWTRSNNIFIKVDRSVFTGVTWHRCSRAKPKEIPCVDNKWSNYLRRVIHVTFFSLDPPLIFIWVLVRCSFVSHTSCKKKIHKIMSNAICYSILVHKYNLYLNKLELNSNRPKGDIY